MKYPWVLSMLVLNMTSFAEQKDFTYLAGALTHPTRIGDFPHRDKIEKKESLSRSAEGYTVNFDDIPVLQLIRFLSQIAKINFVFDNKELDFHVSIISEEATTVEDLMSALLQILKVHGLSAVEQGNNILIYNPKKQTDLSRLSSVITDKNRDDKALATIITRVFKLSVLQVSDAAQIIRPLLSKDAIVESSTATHHLIITDFQSNITKVEELIASIDSPYEEAQIEHYQSHYLDATNLVAFAQKILAPLTKEHPLTLIPEMNSVYIVGDKYIIGRALQVLHSLDTVRTAQNKEDMRLLEGTHFEVVELQNQQGAEIVQSLKALAEGLKGSSKFNEDVSQTLLTAQTLSDRQAILLTGTAHSLMEAKKVIEELDVAPKQVYIEMLIVDVDLATSLNFGVEWAALGQTQSKIAYGAGGFMDSKTASSISDMGQFLAGNSAAGATAPAFPLPSSGLGAGIIGNVLKHKGQSILTLGALVHALEGDLDSSIVMHPRIMTQDGNEATVFIGENIPYQTQSIASGQSGLVTTSLDYKDVGVQLKVTPNIAPNHIVTLDIEQTVSDLKQTAVADSGSSTMTVLAPTTTKTLARTKVHVPDGCFLVMSGQVKDQCTYTRNGVPCLGTLPLVGSLFSNRIDNRHKRNLIMFIRPHIIEDMKEAIAISNQEGYHYNYEIRKERLQDFSREPAPECQALSIPMEES